MARKRKLARAVRDCKPYIFRCLNCNRPTRFSELQQHNSLYCDGCWELVLEGKRLKHSVACLIPGCRNRTDLGDFKGDLCLPCYHYVVRGTGTHSQAYRNELVKANFRILATLKPLRGSATPVMTVATLYGKAGR